MHRRLQRWWRRVRGKASVDLRLTSTTLLDLPDAVVKVLVGFLDDKSLRILALELCRDVLPPLAEAFQERFQLRLPPDAPRGQLLLRLLAQAAMAAAPTRMLTTQFAVADTAHAVDLMPIRSHVRGLAFSSNEYTVWPKHAFQWHIIQQFACLEKLTIDNAWERPLDLSALSQAAPQLQQLVIKQARGLVNRLSGLPHLRVLYFEDTNISSFAIAVGLPKLQELTLLRPRPYLPIEDVALLVEIAPLIKLVTRGTWEANPPNTVGIHLETLREYAECEATNHYPYPTRIHPTRSAMSQLRSLRLGNVSHRDLTPLGSLVMLEHLQVVVAWACLNCVPLRRLLRLRELHLTNGWVCDLVGYLPRLETLIWGGTGFCQLNTAPLARVTLFQRGAARPQSGQARLRRLVVVGDLSIDSRSPSVRAMLEHVEQVEVINNCHTDEVLEAIGQLRHLRRLAFDKCFLRWVRRARDRLVTLACADTLEELFVNPRGIIELDDKPEELSPLPLWFHDRLPNLRVLGSPFPESMAVLARLCPRLTHVHLPLSPHCAFWRTRRSSLRRLCVVTLALRYDCQWLRRERNRKWGALPSLRRIFHPTTDCLSSPWCCRRHVIVGENPTWRHGVFAGDLRLRAPWAYERDEARAPMLEAMEEFHHLSTAGSLSHSA